MTLLESNCLFPMVKSLYDGEIYSTYSGLFCRSFTHINFLLRPFLSVYVRLFSHLLLILYFTASLVS